MLARYLKILGLRRIFLHKFQCPLTQNHRCLLQHSNFFIICCACTLLRNLDSEGFCIFSHDSIANIALIRSFKNYFIHHPTYILSNPPLCFDTNSFICSWIFHSVLLHPGFIYLHKIIQSDRISFNQFYFQAFHHFAIYHSLQGTFRRIVNDIIIHQECSPVPKVYCSYLRRLDRVCTLSAENYIFFIYQFFAALNGF